MNDRRYDRAAIAAAQLLNMGHITSDDPAVVLFQKVARVIYDAMEMAEDESRRQLLKPSEN